MQEDEITKVQQIPEEKWMLSSTDSYVIEQYKTICSIKGKTVLERCGIFDSRSQVEKILGEIRTRPFLLGRDPENRFGKKHG